MSFNPPTNMSHSITTTDTIFTRELVLKSIKYGSKNNDVYMPIKE